MTLRHRLHRRRRLAWGALQRRRQWEYWPSWAMVAPVLPWMLAYAWRAGDAAAFTASNPAIFTGGTVGEPKWPTLEALAAVAPDHVPPGLLLSGDAPPEARVRDALAFFEAQGGAPVVLKPDRGQRGSGVVVARSAEVVARYARDIALDTVLQGWVGGEEYGLFYVRHPSWDRGELWSIGHKVAACVTGDGRRTLEQLVLDDERAVVLAPVHLARLAHRLHEIPADGERIALGEVGAHSRGFWFLDADALRTPALEAAVDRISRGYQGFHIGRYDVRATPDDLREGRFQILELNGVASEQAHIFDPRYRYRDYWRAMRRHWSTAYAIGAHNIAEGAEVTPLPELLRILRTWQRDEKPLHPDESFVDGASSNSP